MLFREKENISLIVNKENADIYHTNTGICKHSKIVCLYLCTINKIKQ